MMVLVVVGVLLWTFSTTYQTHERGSRAASGGFSRNPTFSREGIYRL
jgi:hypothetical protein